MSAESEIQANFSATNSYKFPTKSSCAGSVGGRNITLDRDFAAAQRRGKVNIAGIFKMNTKWL